MAGAVFGTGLGNIAILRRKKSSSSYEHYLSYYNESFFHYQGFSSLSNSFNQGKNVIFLTEMNCFWPLRLSYLATLQDMN